MGAAEERAFLAGIRATVREAQLRLEQILLDARLEPEAEAAWLYVIRSLADLPVPDWQSAWVAASELRMVPGFGPDLVEYQALVRDLLGDPEARAEHRALTRWREEWDKSPRRERPNPAQKGG